MKKMVFKAACIASVVLASGCASILNDSTQKINILTSTGEDIKGSIDGIPFTGPGIVIIDRAKADKIIVVDTPNCVKQTSLNSEVDTVFFLNVLSGGAFGSSTDYGTEKMWEYNDSVMINCKSS